VLILRLYFDRLEVYIPNQLEASESSLVSFDQLSNFQAQLFMPIIKHFIYGLSQLLFYISFFHFMVAVSILLMLFWQVSLFLFNDTTLIYDLNSP
jgi:hypothetical protein